MIAFTIADKANEQYASQMIKSWQHFHPTIPVAIVSGNELAQSLAIDKSFFYRATPTMAKRLMNDHDEVIKLDADQLILGNMDFVLEGHYDVGTVLNINRIDPKTYGNISITGVPSSRYYNCGLVVMKNKDFVNDWLDLCFGKYFTNLQYREQDLLNILCHYGKYRVKCFDDYDNSNNYHAWHGLVAKGETLKAYIKDGDIIIPPDDNNYPDKPTILKAYHFAGGKGRAKMNYRTIFNEEVISHIDKILA